MHSEFAFELLRYEYTILAKFHWQLLKLILFSIKCVSNSNFNSIFFNPGYSSIHTTPCSKSPPGEIGNICIKRTLVENNRLKRQIQTGREKMSQQRKTILGLRKQVNKFKTKVKRMEVSLKTARTAENSGLDVRCICSYIIYTHEKMICKFLG